MNKADAAKELGIEVFDFELAAMQAGLNDEQTDFTDEEVQKVADLLGILLENSRAIAPAIDCGAITKAEASAIVASRLKPLGFTLEPEEIDYLYASTAAAFKKLASSLASVAIETFSAEMAGIKDEILISSQQSLVEVSKSIKNAEQHHLPKTSPVKIDFKKLQEQNKEMFK